MIVSHKFRRVGCSVLTNVEYIYRGDRQPWQFALGLPAPAASFPRALNAWIACDLLSQSPLTTLTSTSTATTNAHFSSLYSALEISVSQLLCSFAV